MIYHNGKQVGFIYKGNKLIEKIYKNGKLYYEKGFLRETIGASPLTIKGVDLPLKNYEIFGNTTQETTTGKNIFYFDNTTTLYSNNGATFLSWDLQNQSFKFKTSANKNHTGMFIKNMLETDSVIYSAQGIIKTNYTGTIKIRIGSGNSTYKTLNVESGKEYLVKYENIKNTGHAAIFYLDNTNIDTDIEVEIRQVMIEKSTSCSTYEPYTGAQPSPNPDYPQEIESVGDLVTDTTDANYGKYKIPVNVASENLAFNYSSNPNKSKYGNALYIDFEPKLNKTYCVSFIDESVGNNYYRNENFMGTYSSYSIVSDGKRQKYYFTPKTIDKTGSLVYVQDKGYIIFKNNKTQENSPSFKDVMIEEVEDFNVEPKPYQPYYNTTTNIYLSAPLRKIGDYADYVDFKEGKVVRNIGEVIFEGSESLWNLQSINSYNIANFRITINKTLKSYCNSFTKQNSLISVTKTEGYMIAEYRTLYIRINANRCSTINEFKNWLSQNHIIFDYSLETPTEETITLPSILTTNGTNNITIDTKTPPSNIYLKYKSEV